MSRKHDDHLLPDNTSLSIVDVVHLIEDHPFDIADEVRTAIQHRSQNLGGHYETGRVRLNADISRQEADIKLLAKIPEFLVGDGLDW